MENDKIRISIICSSKHVNYDKLEEDGIRDVFDSIKSDYGVYHIPAEGNLDITLSICHCDKLLESDKIYILPATSQSITKDDITRIADYMHKHGYLI